MITNRKISPSEIMTIANKYKSVLEIGCGEGQFINNLKCPIKVGIEGCTELVNKYKQNFINHNTTILNMNILDLNNIYMDDSFECIIAVDIIEHFEKDVAFEVLKTCERLASKAILCFIPVGNHPQTHDPRGFINELNDHKSSWYPEDMELLEYNVFYDSNFHNEPNKDHGAMLAYKIKENL